uniref:Uncharacterized protein n=1 Tax=Panagrolaimus sp. JU765 TaxID=591449 RepID=A0AC34RBJ8_9BILA
MIVIKIVKSMIKMKLVVAVVVFIFLGKIKAEYRTYSNGTSFLEEPTRFLRPTVTNPGDEFEQNIFASQFHNSNISAIKNTELPIQYLIRGIRAVLARMDFCVVNQIYEKHGFSSPFMGTMIRPMFMYDHSSGHELRVEIFIGEMQSEK